jgi:hypothetical protein
MRISMVLVRIVVVAASVSITRKTSEMTSTLP